MESLSAYKRLTHWLVMRQIVAPTEDDDSDPEEIRGDIVAPTSMLQWAGFNGRCNKPPDTCYSFWAVGSLGVRVFSARFALCPVR